MSKEDKEILKEMQELALDSFLEPNSERTLIEKIKDKLIKGK